MGIEINDLSTVEKEVKYPHLARWKLTGAIYWRVEQGKGVKLTPSDHKSIVDVGELANLNTCQDKWEILPAGSSFTFVQE